MLRSKKTAASLRNEYYLNALGMYQQEILLLLFESNFGMIGNYPNIGKRKCII